MKIKINKEKLTVKNPQEILNTISYGVAGIVKNPLEVSNG
jgi:hypothetical protein